ncbi:MAG TPA: acyloxyacyl hydrolase, partial [Gemmatimonadaceae bacterium]|nr:acyloxyacyl hydrolase [Gemmatimonadaceae bacterium]
WAAGSNGSPFLTRTGIRHRDFYQVAVRYERPLFATPGLRLEYLLDLVPAAMSTNDPVDFTIVPCGNGNEYDGCYQPRTQTVYAAGLSPIGLAVQLFPDAPVSLRISGTAGALLFTRRIPDPLAGAFNFTAVAGLSAAVDMTHGFALDVGILGHHTSNGGTARANPGLNSRMLMIGVARRGR